MFETMSNQHLVNKIRWIESKAKQGFWKDVKIPDTGSRSVVWSQRQYFHNQDALTVLSYDMYLQEKQRRGL